MRLFSSSDRQPNPPTFPTFSLTDPPINATFSCHFMFLSCVFFSSTGYVCRTGFDSCSDSIARNGNGFGSLENNTSYLLDELKRGDCRQDKSEFDQDLGDPLQP